MLTAGWFQRHVQACGGRRDVALLNRAWEYTLWYLRREGLFKRRDEWQIGWRYFTAESLARPRKEVPGTPPPAWLPPTTRSWWVHTAENPLLRDKY